MASPLIYVPHMTFQFKSHPQLFLLPMLGGADPAEYQKKCGCPRDKDTAFLYSSIITACLLILFAVGLYPNIVILFTTDPAYSISIYAAGVFC